MSKAWDGEFQFKLGEEVKVTKGPFKGHEGLVQVCQSTGQFKVLLHPSWRNGGVRELFVFGDTLELLPIAKARREREAAKG